MTGPTWNTCPSRSSRSGHAGSFTARRSRSVRRRPCSIREILMPGRKYYGDGELFDYDLFSSTVRAERPDGRRSSPRNSLSSPAVSRSSRARRHGAIPCLRQRHPAHAARACRPGLRRDRTPASTGTQAWPSGASRLPNDAGLIFKVLGMETEPVRAAVRAFWSLAREDSDRRTRFPTLSSGRRGAGHDRRTAWTGWWNSNAVGRVRRRLSAGRGQVIFQNNPLTGLLFIVAHRLGRARRGPPSHRRRGGRRARLSRPSRPCCSMSTKARYDRGCSASTASWSGRGADLPRRQRPRCGCTPGGRRCRLDRRDARRRQCHEDVGPAGATFPFVLTTWFLLLAPIPSASYRSPRWGHRQLPHPVDDSPACPQLAPTGRCWNRLRRDRPRFPHQQRRQRPPLRARTARQFGLGCAVRPCRLGRRARTVARPRRRPPI